LPTRRLALLAWCIASASAIPAAAHAASILDRVRGEGVVQCASIIRPGLAFPMPAGGWRGLNIDLCRAIAERVLGPKGRIEFHPLTLPLIDPARRPALPDVAFLTEAEIIGLGWQTEVLRGPRVFEESDGVMVFDTSPAHHITNLANAAICDEPGTPPERALVAWFAARKIPLRYFPFQESDEQVDAYYAGRCAAVANEVTNLAALRVQAQTDGHPSRILPERLSTFPILAVTGAGDKDWAAMVASVVRERLRSEQRPVIDSTLGLPPSSN
jgi:general L-amino acid transport system substrate-binding protein